MPINAGPEYFVAEKKFSQAKTKEQKIVALEEMIRALPRHKGTDHMLAQMRKRLAKLRDEVESSGKGTSHSGFSLKKEGAAQVCIVGQTQVGKSSLLRSITNAFVKVDTHPFTTKEPAIGMTFHNDVPIQMVEIPSTFEPKFLSIMRTCDLILVLLDATRNVAEQEMEMKNFLEEKAINVKKIFVRNKRFVGKSKYLNISSEERLGLDELKEKIWSELELIRVYTKSPDGEKQLPPLAMKPGSTVRDLTKEIHKDFLRNFKFARVFNNTKYSGQKVGLDFILHDMDVVEIHTEI